MTRKKVVIIGGGTGIYPVTTAFKHLPADISTIIGVADSGGSTGRIRDEFGFQPVGDLRQSLAALAEGEGSEWIRKLLLYRFSKGTGLKGHNLGNLILTALQDMTHNTSEALFRAQQIFRLSGTVIPTTNDVIDLEIIYEDGTTMIGEDYLNAESALPKKVVDVRLTPQATANPHAIKAILDADVIVIGPGDYYANLIATLAPQGFQTAFAETKAKVIYIVNLMNRHYQTDSMTATDYVRAIEHAIGRSLDTIIVNNEPIPEEFLNAYQKSKEYPVADDLADDKRVVRASVVTAHELQREQSDALSRSYLRHDSQKLIPVFEHIVSSLT